MVLHIPPPFSCDELVSSGMGYARERASVLPFAFPALPSTSTARRDMALGACHCHSMLMWKIRFFLPAVGHADLIVYRACL